jgi:crotonobetainyl-CoA:carnitine CoA-transferase CaiB-like acyl-CoA transferase
VSAAPQVDWALGGLRIVELGTGLALRYGTGQLAALGAEVIAVRPPGDDAVGSGERTARARLLEHLDSGKTTVAGARPDEGDRARVRALCADADVLVEDLGPGGLEEAGLAPPDLRRSAPRLAVVRVSANGQHGPRAQHRWTPFTLQAAAGWVNRHDSRDVTGVPFQVGGHYGELAVGAFVATAALTAMVAARRRGVGEDVDVAMTTCLHSTLQRTRMRQDYFRELGIETKGIGRQALAVHRCADGWVGLNILTGQQWSDICAMMGLVEFTDKQAELGENEALRLDFDRRADSWCRERTVAEIVELGQALRIPAVPVTNGRTVTEIPQWRARPFFRERGGTTVPGPALRPASMPVRVDDERREGALATAGWTGSARRPSGPAAGDPVPTAAPFDGIRVVDLGNFYAAPYLTQFLGALGADIIKIEGPRRPDGFRFVGTSPRLGDQWHERSMLFQATNLNKRSVAVDLTTTEGRAIVLRLVEQADVVVENFSARVMANFGLDFDALRAVNPRIVVLRMPGFGLAGPWRDYVGFGPGFEQAAGLAEVTGFPDGPPGTPGGYLDPVVGMHGALTVLAALEHRDRTGQADMIEVAQLEIAANMAAGEIIACSATGAVETRVGNRSAWAVPQGVYPCQSDTGWLALSVCSDEEWAALAMLMGDPDCALAPEFAEAAGRTVAHDEIDERIRAWTAVRNGAALVEQLQSCGIAAAEVLSPATYLEDEQLRYRGYYAPVQHPVTGTRPYPGLPFIADYVPHHRRRSPLLGEHTREVLESLLGVPDADLDRWQAAGIIGDHVSGAW